jgi:hypothetical protein
VIPSKVLVSFYCSTDIFKRVTWVRTKAFINISVWWGARPSYFECARKLRSESPWHGVGLFVLGYGCSQVCDARWMWYVVGIIVFQLRKFNVISIWVSKFSQKFKVYFKLNSSTKVKWGSPSTPWWKSYTKVLQNQGGEINTKYILN